MKYRLNIGWLYKLIDFFLPPLKFRLDKKPSNDELDRKATEILDTLERVRRQKRAKYKN